MNTNQGRLFYATGIDNSQLQADAAESRNILHSIGQTAQDEGNRMDAAFGRMAKAAGGIFAIGQVTEFAKQIIAVRGEIESLQISFETLAGKTKGDALFGEIRQFAVSTPMMMKDLASGAQTMLAFNIEVEKVMPMLRAIGDVSMGDAQKFNSLTLAFSQMSATGKLMGQDLLQMINAGFNPLSVISEKTGKSIGELKEEMEKGKITTDMVTEAFLSATAAGGKFHGMLEKQSHGINGAISNLQGAIDDLYNSIGESSQGIISGAINGATYLVKNYEAIAEILAVIVGTYGVYKAAVITNEAMIQAALTAKDMAVKEAFESEMAALTALIPEKEAEAQTSLQQAVAAGHITQEKAAEIAMLRAEAQAQLEALAVTESAAKARLMASQADVAAAIKWEDEIKEKIDALEEEADALFENGDSIAFNAKQEEIAALKAELLEVQKERETAVEAANTAATEMNAASHQQNAIATTQDSAATAVNTAQTTTNTGVTSALAIAKTKLIGVVRTLYATISAHPFALAAAAVAALAYGIYKLVTYETDAEKAQKRLNETTKECNASIASEKIQIDTLFTRLKNAKEGTDEYKKAKEAIITQYGSYLDGLSAEVRSLKDVEAAYKAIKTAAIEAARARAMETAMKNEADEYGKVEGEQMAELEKVLKKKFGDRDIKGDGRKAWVVYFEQVKRVIQNGGNINNLNQDWLKQFDEKKTRYLPGDPMTGIGAQTLEWTENDITKIFGKVGKARNVYNNAMEEAERRFGAAPERTTQSPAKAAKTQAQYNKKDWEDYKKEKQAEYYAMTEAERTSAEGRKLAQDILTADEKIQGYNVTGNAKSGASAANKTQKIQEYADAVVKAQREAEFEIRQNEINLLKDGVEKELKQNELNYDRLIFANQQRQAEMVESLRDVKELEWENANPTAEKQGLTFDRSTITDADLSEAQQKTLREYARIAGEIRVQGEREAMDKMLSEVHTYEQQRLKITEEFAQKRDALYDITRDKDGNETGRTLKKGVTQGNLDEVNRQEDEALKAVDEQFASREETYQAWCETIADMSLENLKRALKDAKNKLDELKKSGNADPKALAQASAQVATAEKAVNKAEAKNKTNPGKRTIKEWEDLYKTLNEVEKEFESIGDTVGGVVGDIISKCGAVATSSMQMINGIVQLTQWSLRAEEMAAQGASKSIQQVEKASVILTVISAALQIAMQIANLFNNDAKKQEEIEHLQDRIDQLQWELDHQDIGRVQAQYGTAISRLNKALAESHAELAKGQTGWRRLVTLTSRASDNQQLMQKTAEKLADAYSAVAYSADKALGEGRFESASAQLKNIAQQQILLQEQINAEASKKKSDSSQIDEWKNKIEELGQQAIELINEMVEEIIGDTSTGIAEELMDAFIDAFQAGEDAAKAWGDKVNEIVGDILKRMLISKFLEEPLGEIFDKYKAKWFKDGNFVGIDAVISSMKDFSQDLNNVGKDFNEIWSALPQDIRESIKGASGMTEQSATAGTFETMSQDVGMEINGRAAAIQISNEIIKENTAIANQHLAAIASRTDEIRGSVDELRAFAIVAVDYLETIAANTSEMKQMNERLNKIEINTR